MGRSRGQGRRFAVIAAWLASAFALIALVLAYLAIPPADPDTREARSFLQGYFDATIQEPTRAWEKLSDQMQADYLKDHDKDRYRAFYQRYEAIRVTSVKRQEGSSSWKAHVIYERRVGPSRQVDHIFKLTCPSWTKILRTGCSTGRIRLAGSAREDPSG